MNEEKKAQERVTFGRGHDVCIMGIDGTWRRDCLLNAISDNDAVLTVEGSIQGLNLKEFFLLLSSTGLAYRRCELVGVNGTEMENPVPQVQGRQEGARGSALGSAGCPRAPLIPKFASEVARYHANFAELPQSAVA